MLKYLDDICFLDDLSNIVAHMMDEISMIRDGLYDYDTAVLLISRRVLMMDYELGCAISKKFARMMDYSFMLKYQHVLDWRNIMSRRDLSFGFILSLKHSTVCKIIDKINYTYSSMSVGEALLLISFAKYIAPWFSMSTAIDQLIKRDMSSHDIDSIIMFAFNNHIHIAFMELYQILTETQIMRVHHIGKLFGNLRPVLDDSHNSKEIRDRYADDTRSLRDILNDDTYNRQVPLEDLDIYKPTVSDNSSLDD
jgi:hypothetical protein